jgi:hypothetical protein
MVKRCRTCGLEKPLEMFSPHPRCELGRYPECKECRNAWARAKYARDPERILAGQREARRRRPKQKMQEWARLRKYGLSREAFQEMVDAQDRRCAICGTTPDVLVVDHCHKTGVTRGLLCRWCNVGLGMFRDDPAALEQAHSYLERWRRGLTRQS